MGWGAPFGSLWNTATDVAKSTASKAAQTASSAYDYTKKKVAQGYDYTKEKAVQGYEYSKEKAVQGYQYAKKKAVEYYDAKKNEFRDNLREDLDEAYDKVGAVGEGVRRTGNAIGNAAGWASGKAQEAYDGARALFGLKPAAAPVQPCPMPTMVPKVSTAKEDKSIDGWIMSPQGPGKECIAIPPGPGALAKARKLAKPDKCDCNGGRNSTQRPKDIVYVNGIDTKGETHCSTLNAIAAQTCARVVGVYNATEGFAADALQTSQDRRLVKFAGQNKAIPESDGRNPAVKTLSDTVFNEVMDGSNPEIWAHSQGAAVTSLGLYEANNTLALFSGSRENLSGLNVKTFGGASPNWVDGPQYEHFIHVDDFTPSSFGLGHNPVDGDKSAGKGAKMVRFAGDPGSDDPFEAVRPNKSWTPSPKARHGVEDTYLRMERQTNGGCN